MTMQMIAVNEGYTIAEGRWRAMIGLCAALVFGAVAVSQAAQGYHFTQHVTVSFAGSHNPTATAITDTRAICAVYSDPQDDLWSFKKVGRAETRLLVSGYFPTVHGCNNVGQAIGYVFRHEQMGFRIDADGTIEYYMLSHETSPMDINDEGIEVGWFRGEANDLWCYVRDTSQATDWHPAPEYRFQIVAGLGCRVMDINAAREMAGSYQTEDGFEHGWYTIEGVPHVVDVPGKLATWIEHVNLDGSVAGTTLEPDWMYRGFYRSPSGVLTSDIQLPGAVATVVRGGNARGDLVGSFLYLNTLGRYQWGIFIANPVTNRVGNR
jgi:hypothetical protein